MIKINFPVATSLESVATPEYVREQMRVEGFEWSEQEMIQLMAMAVRHGSPEQVATIESWGQGLSAEEQDRISHWPFGWLASSITEIEYFFDDLSPTMSTEERAGEGYANWFGDILESREHLEGLIELLKILNLDTTGVVPLMATLDEIASGYVGGWAVPALCDSRLLRAAKCLNPNAWWTKFT